MSWNKSNLLIFKLSLWNISGWPPAELSDYQRGRKEGRKSQHASDQLEAFSAWGTKNGTDYCCHPACFRWKWRKEGKKEPEKWTPLSTSTLHSASFPTPPNLWRHFYKLDTGLNFSSWARQRCKQSKTCVMCNMILFSESKWKLVWHMVLAAHGVTRAQHRLFPSILIYSFIILTSPKWGCHAVYQWHIS